MKRLLWIFCLLMTLPLLAACTDDTPPPVSPPPAMQIDPPPAETQGSSEVGIEQFEEPNETEKPEAPSAENTPISSAKNGTENAETGADAAGELSQKPSFIPDNVPNAPEQTPADGTGESDSPQSPSIPSAPLQPPAEKDRDGFYNQVVKP